MAWLTAKFCEQGSLPARAGASQGGVRAAPRRAPALALAFAAGLHAEGPRRGGSGATYERVLRYPDGRERRIRYPMPPADAVAEDLGTDCSWDTLNEWKSLTTWADPGGRASSGGRTSSSSSAAAGAALAAPALDEVTRGEGPPHRRRALLSAGQRFPACRLLLAGSL